MDNQELFSNQKQPIRQPADKNQNLSWMQDEAIQFPDSKPGGGGPEAGENEEDFKKSILAGINQEAMAEAVQDIAESGENNLFSRTEELAFGRLEGEEEEAVVLETEIEVEGKMDLAEGAVVLISKNKLEIVRKLFNNIKENARILGELLGGDLSRDPAGIGIEQFSSADYGVNINDQIGNKVIEGVFNGQHMIGPDGKQYNVPSNYASKSKLVEGDILKLTINAVGKFIYKQIGPIERERIVGRLILGKNSEYFVESGDQRWKILTASVTYFKGNVGDEAIILVPKQGESNWAAVENIINKP